MKVDVAFIGSCTNGRLSDFRPWSNCSEEAAKGQSGRARPGRSRLAALREELIERGWDQVFTQAGFEFREAGCSMCLAMNPDKLVGREVCASSSNRNFKGRQGSSTGRTLLMSPAMVAAAAIRGEVADAREVFGISA